MDKATAIWLVEGLYDLFFAGEEPDLPIKSFSIWTLEDDGSGWGIRSEQFAYGELVRFLARTLKISERKVSNLSPLEILEKIDPNNELLDEEYEE